VRMGRVKTVKWRLEDDASAKATDQDAADDERNCCMLNSSRASSGLS